MCARCDNEDYDRTVRLLKDLITYTERPGADADFADVMCEALGASLPCVREADADHSGSIGDHPGEEW